MNPDLTTTTTPPFPFDLALAKLGWTIVQRCGRPARLLADDLRGSEPLAISVTDESGDERAFSVEADGIFVLGHKSEEDLFLSSDTSIPAVREAMRKAHAAGAEVWAKRKTADTWVICNPAWLWQDFDYILSQHLPEAARGPQPPPAQPMVPWDCPDDVPHDWSTIWAKKDEGSYIVTAIDKDGMIFDGSYFSWRELGCMSVGPSFRGPWRPCTKEVKS